MKTRINSDIKNSGISALKKKRDRALKLYYLDDITVALDETRALTKKLKREVRRNSKRIYEQKANTANHKGFWNVVKKIQGINRTYEKLTIEDENGLHEDPTVIGEIMADFFCYNAENLMKRTSIGPVQQPTFNHNS